MALLDTIDIEERALLASRGDGDALGELYEHYADQVLRFVRLRVGHDLALAEDVASATWEKVARSIRGYTLSGAGFPAWLFAIAKNTAREHQRGLARRRETLTGEALAGDEHSAATPYEEVEMRLRAHRVAAAVRRLPTRQRRCVTLRWYVGLSTIDAAAEMGLKPNALKQLQYRAMSNLAALVGEDALLLPAATETTISIAASGRPTIRRSGDTTQQASR